MMFNSNMITGVAVVALSLCGQLTSAMSLDVNDQNSIKSAAATAAYGLMKWYTGNVTNTPDTIAVLGRPYYWWEAGAMWGAMLDYYHFTGDSSYNPTVTQALLSQVGPNYDYMMPNRNKETGNDDQAFWGFATMAAAEQGFPDPPSPIPSWAQLTINIWNTQAARWDTSTCAGGLRWQIFPYNKGYDYKNSVSNGAFFQLSARLARFTGNATYSDWAYKSFEWSQKVGLIDSDYNVYDGTDDLKNCSDVNKMQWSYSAGIYTYGAAIMYNITSPPAGSTPDISLPSRLWSMRTTSLLSQTIPFFFSPFPNATNILYEQACEVIQTCNYDQWSFKGYLSRFLWASTIMAPFTSSTVNTLLTTSAKAAAQSCSGEGVNKCGSRWYYNGYDGVTGPGQQMAALETIQGLLTGDVAKPRTANGASASGGGKRKRVKRSSDTAPLSSSEKVNAAASGMKNMSFGLLAIVAAVVGLVAGF